jgi:hypothetical protein
LADLHSHPDQDDPGADNFFSRKDMDAVADPAQTWEDSFLAAPDGSIKRITQTKARFTQRMLNAYKDVNKKPSSEQLQYYDNWRYAYPPKPDAGKSGMREIITQEQNYDRWR